MRRICFLCIAFSLLFLSACTSEEAPAAGVGDSGAAAFAPATDPLTGTWVGDWGPTPDTRNPVTVALTWDGTTLNGTVNPGENAVAITKASFAADTGVVMIEASGNGNGGKTIHYAVEGKLVEGSIAGTWMDGERKGDFKIKRS